MASHKPHGHAAAQGEALQRGEDQVVADEDDQRADHRHAAPAAMRAHRQRESEQHEDDRGHRKGEPLVELGFVRGPIDGIVPVLPDLGDELRQVQIPLGLLDARCGLQR